MSSLTGIIKVKKREKQKMKRDDTGREIKQGDRITITTPFQSESLNLRDKNIQLSGTVIDANWWNGDGWYIEFNADTTGYCYWKEKIDKGWVELLSA